VYGVYIDGGGPAGFAGAGAAAGAATGSDWIDAHMSANCRAGFAAPVAPAPSKRLRQRGHHDGSPARRLPQFGHASIRVVSDVDSRGLRTSCASRGQPREPISPL